VILEVGILNVKADQGRDFEAAFKQALPIIQASPGFVSHELNKCIETPDQYLLLVRWQTLEDHTVGFRQSEPYQEWKRLLHRFYDPFPMIEHYEV
jgi:heme-degrading monooxygenase HmoA